MRRASRQAEVLLIEDNPGDVELIEEALRPAVPTRTHVTSDGESAMLFLRRTGGYQQAPPADLVLLDLNLPGMNGFELLAEIKSLPDLAGVPVVVLTSSDADPDVLRSYQAGANCVITKPVDVEQFLEVVRRTGEFWLSTARLPSRTSGTAQNGIG